MRKSSVSQHPHQPQWPRKLSLLNQINLKNMNTLALVETVKEFLGTLKESSFVYSPESFTDCPYPVLCINRSKEISYQNKPSVKISKASQIFGKPSFDKIFKESGIKTSLTKQKDWAVTLTNQDWILVVLVPNQVDFKIFKTWKEFTSKPIHGTTNLIRKIEDVRTGIDQIQKRMKTFRRVTDLAIQFQQYLMEETHVL